MMGITRQEVKIIINNHTIPRIDGNILRGEFDWQMRAAHIDSLLDPLKNDLQAAHGTYKTSVFALGKRFSIENSEI